MSDLHYDLHYLPGAPADCLFDKLGLGCCRNTSIPDPTRPLRSAGKWGDFNCDTPLTFLNETFRWIREQLFPLDVLIVSGDLVDHHDFSQSFEENMRAVEELSDLLAFWFNNISTTTTTIIPVFGNHDTWPVDQLLPESEVQRRMAKIWSKHGWIPHTEYEQFAKNGYYLLSNATARDGVSAVITNSLYYHVDNIFLNRSTDVGDQWSWLWSLPKNLTRDKLTLWTGHIVPGSGSVTANYTRGMERLAADYKQTDTPETYVGSA